MKICTNTVLLALLGAVFIAPSCKKAIAQEEASVTSEVFSQSATAAANPWGVVINSSSSDPLFATDVLKQTILSPASKIDLAKDYGVKYIRTNLTKEEWDTQRSGFLYTYGNFVDNGFSMLLTITWKDPVVVNGKPTGVEFPYDANNPTSPYYKFVKQVIDSLTKRGMPPAVVVVENEETNKNYHVIEKTSDYDKYIDMLKAVTTICHAKSIKVTNGGLTLRGLTYVTWDWLKNVKGKPTEAQTFALNSMPPSSYYALYPPRPVEIKSAGIENINGQIDMMQYFISKYTTLSLDYVNFHWYEPAIVRGWVDSANGGSPWKNGIDKNDTCTGSLDNVLRYLTTSVKPKKVISNEIGQFTTSDCLTRKIMKKIASRPYNAFEIASWFDGDGDSEYEAHALHNTFILTPFYTKRSSGVTFKRLVGDAAANPSCSPLK